MATNLYAGASNLSNVKAEFDIPVGMTVDRPCDIVPMNNSRFYNNTLLAVSAYTTSGRKIYLYNADRPEYAPMDISPASGLNEWRNRLATYGPYLFMSYDAGGESPGLMRLSLYDYDLSPLGIPEPASITGILLLVFMINRKRRQK